MLELVAATTIIALALVPALKLTRDSLMSMEALERNEIAANLCASMLEEELARTASSWSLSGRQGNFSAVGRPELKFMVTKSDAFADGGVPNSLAVIEVVVWYDADAGNDPDADEPQTRFSSKLARVLSYEYEANLH